MKKYTFALLIVIVLTASCRSQQTLTEALSDIKTERRQEYGKDSIVIRDSIVYRVARDTVYRERWRTEYKDRYVERVDTLVQERERLVETVVEKKVIPKWCWWCVALCALCILFLIIRIGLIVGKRLS
ncbi:MAG: hypothetical protein IJ776_10690 [Paludibacteraceae bacterium]|nr:hypothetical protein [Paludibacteraceae bacterium]